MFGIGMSEIMYVIGFIVVMLFLSARKQGTGGWSPGPALVLKKFTINKAAAGPAALVDIIGRPGGLISWLLTIIGLDSTWNLKVTTVDFSLREASLFGQQDSVVPVSSISSVHCGYRKPVGYFFVSAAFLLLGLGGAFAGDSAGARMSSFFGGVAFAALFFVCYFLNKTIVIYIISRGGTKHGLSFKRSVIENIAVDIQQAQLAIGIINTLVIKSQKIVNVETADVMESAVKNLTENKSSAPRACTHCGKPLEEGSRFCTSCGQGV